MAPEMAQAGLSWRRLQQEVEVKQHSLALLQQRIAGSQSAQLAQAVAASEAELQEASQAAAAAQQKRADMVKAAQVNDCPNLTKSPLEAFAFLISILALSQLLSGMCRKTQGATCQV